MKMDQMDHERAIERTHEIAILYRTRSADPYRVRRGDALDCEALRTLLTAVEHVPVGRDQVPLWAGKEPVWTNCGGYVLRWKVIAVEENGVRLSGSAASNKLHIFSEVFSSREAVEKGGAG